MRRTSKRVSPSPPSCVSMTLLYVFFVCVRTHDRSADARLHAMDQRTSNEGKRACRKERVG